MRPTLRMALAVPPTAELSVILTAKSTPAPVAQVMGGVVTPQHTVGPAASLAAQPQLPRQTPPHLGPMAVAALPSLVPLVTPKALTEVAAQSMGTVEKRRFIAVQAARMDATTHPALLPHLKQSPPRRHPLPRSPFSASQPLVLTMAQLRPTGPAVLQMAVLSAVIGPKGAVALHTVYVRCL